MTTHSEQSLEVELIDRLYIDNYKKYLNWQNEIEWFYDFHPEFFDKLASDERELLEKYFLYKTSDEDYPESIECFYKENIYNKPDIAKKLMHAIKALHEIAGVKE